jgi:hypothetical protein
MILCLCRLELHEVQKPISDRQTATGTKDKVAQYWIDILLQKAREMKNAQPGRTGESIANELKQWFALQPGDKINLLLSIAGEEFKILLQLLDD